MAATRILPFTAATIGEAAALIAAGEPVAVPTETVYGLAADATSGSAVARIYAAKGRPSFNPLIVHVADAAAAAALARLDPPTERLAARFWPGPLTIVAPLRPDAPIAELVTAGLDTVAIRVPAHPAMRALLDATGLPLAAPSANISGAISPTAAHHVRHTLDGRIPLVIDAGPTGLGLESTIVAVAAGRVTLLRPGPVTAEAIAAVIGHLPMARDAAEGISAPGQLASHYAPAKPVRLEATTAAADEVLIGFGAVPGALSLSPAGDLLEAAATLFARLHEADARPESRIAVAPVPRHGLGLAINDRLARAAADRP